MSYTESTRNRILRTAVSLFAQKGFSKVSMREIAKECGIKGASIYHHFPSKDSILVEGIGAMVSGIEPPLHDPVALNQFVDAHDLRTILLFNSEDYKRTFSEDPMMSDIVRIVSMEMQTDPGLRMMFRGIMLEKPRIVWTVIFQRLIDTHRIRDVDASTLVDEFVLHGLGMFMEHFLLRDEFDVTSFLAIVDGLLNRRLDMYQKLLEV